MSNTVFMFEGVWYNSHSFGKKFGINPATIRGRLDRGWPPERLLEPVDEKHRNRRKGEANVYSGPVYEYLQLFAKENFYEKLLTKRRGVCYGFDGTCVLQLQQVLNIYIETSVH